MVVKDAINSLNVFLARCLWDLYMALQERESSQYPLQLFCSPGSQASVIPLKQKIDAQVFYR